MHGPLPSPQQPGPRSGAARAVAAINPPAPANGRAPGLGACA
jgi:hypothetical protein